MADGASDGLGRSSLCGHTHAPMGTQWFVYVLASTHSNRTYVGITTDPLRRLAQHNGELPGGARATRAGRPWRVAAEYGPYEGRGDALRVERAVKRLRGRHRFSWTPGSDLRKV
jgi:predicted GIY-YIG superfamily endonuclease